jgi:group I intron endonuclease
MLFYFYCITNLINNKIYVGITNAPDKRWKTHLNIAKGGKEKFPAHFQAIHAAIVKYGEEQFIFDISKIFSDEDEAYHYEQDFISYMKEMKVPNYNIAGGGKGTGSGINHPTFGKKLPKEWIDNMSVSLKESSNRPEVKEGNRQRMIDRNWVGENHPMFGKTHTEEARAAISLSQTGLIKSKETCRKLSEALTGRVFTPEHCENISKSQKGKHVGEKNVMFGKTHTPEARAAISAARTGTISTSRKLSEEQVREIMKLLSDNVASRKIAKIFETHKSVILNIKHKRSYKEIIERIENEQRK